MSLVAKKTILAAAGNREAGNPYGEILDFGGSYALYSYDFDSSSNLYGQFVGSQQKNVRLNAVDYDVEWEKRISTSTSSSIFGQYCAVNNDDDVYFANLSSTSSIGAYLSLLDGATGAAIGNQTNLQPPSGNEYELFQKGEGITIFQSTTTLQAKLSFYSPDYLGGSIISVYFDNDEASPVIGARYADMNKMTVYDSCLAGTVDAADQTSTFYAGYVSSVVSPVAPTIFNGSRTLQNQGCNYYPFKYSGTAYAAYLTSVSVDYDETVTNKDLAVAGVADYGSFGNQVAFVAIINTDNLASIGAFTTFYTNNGTEFDSTTFVKAQCYDGFVYVILQDDDNRSDFYFFKLSMDDLSIEWQYKVSGFNANSQPFGRLVLMRNTENDLFFSTRYEAIAFSRDGLPTGTYGSYTVSVPNFAHDSNFTFGPYTTVSVTSGNVSGESNTATTMSWTDTTDISVTTTSLE
jgi:hypothetical protein